MKEGIEEAVIPVLQQQFGRLGLIRRSDVTKLALEYEPYVSTYVRNKTGLGSILNVLLHQEELDRPNFMA